MRMYYKITIADGLYFGIQGVDPTQAFFDYVVHGTTGLRLYLGKAGKNALVKNVGISLDPIFNSLTDQQIRTIYPAIFYTWNHRVHTQQNIEKINLELFSQLTSDHLWTQVEAPIQHTFTQLETILTDPGINNKDLITVQFRRPEKSGICKDKADDWSKVIPWTSGEEYINTKCRN
jgi:hypothetical protein